MSVIPALATATQAPSVGAIGSPKTLVPAALLLLDISILVCGPHLADMDATGTKRKAMHMVRRPAIVTLTMFGCYNKLQKEGGGAGFRTRVLFSPPIKDYTFRSVFSNTPKFVGYYLSLQPTPNERFNLGFNRTLPHCGLLLLGYVS